jgi:hypothetical protein
MKKGCEAKVKIKVDRDIESLVVCHMNLSHNHEISDDDFAYYHQNRALRRADENLKQQVLNMIETEANPRLILNFLEQKTGRIESYDAIKNLKQKFKLKKSDTLNDAQELIMFARNELKIHNISSLEVNVNEENILESIFWQTQMMKQIFNQHNNIICVDATFNLNRSGYALFIIITIDANWDTRIVALGLVTSDKRSDIIESFFNWFNRENPKHSEIKTIMSDKNESQINILKALYPDSDIALCLYHVFKTFKLETRKKLPSFELEEIRGQY